ncbi:MAG TPA: TetR/AcrR family transcriptional regulator [Dehalococcoidia bacterium]|nr:TetR/AcrR family transcriptional regulator [Dehalococcoidia bacterium]
MVAQPEAIDGRAARAERTRDAVVDAVLELIGEGKIRPGAPAIAERAGVSLRTVFHHYADLEALFSAAAERHFARVLGTAPRIDRSLPLEARIDAFASARGALLETITPVRRAAVLLEPFSPEIARRLAWMRARGRRETERVFAAEIGRRRGAARGTLREALTAATSWPAWEMLRAHQGLSPGGARNVMAHMLRALLKEDD